MRDVFKSTVVFFSSVLFFLVLVEVSFAGSPTFYLDPASGSYDPGEEFDVDIMINTDGEKVETAKVSISYDPDVVQVTDVKHSSIFCQYPESEYEVDNSGGLVILTGYCNDSPYTTSSGADIFGRITFKAMSGGSAVISFNYDGSDDSDMTYMTTPGSPPKTLDITEPDGATFSISGAGSPGSDDLPDTGIWDNAGFTFGISLILLSFFVFLADLIFPPFLKWLGRRGQRTIVV